MSLSFDNMSAFLSRGAAALIGLEKEGGDVLERVANDIADEVRSSAPVSPDIPEATPGELANSVAVVRTGNKVDIFVDAPYALQVEYGTSKMAAEPFFQPALAAAKV